MRAKCSEWNLVTDSPLTPATQLYSFYSNSRRAKPVLVKWGLVEKKGLHYGLGIFPVLEAIGHSKLPAKGEAEEEVVSLLRSFKPAVNLPQLADLEKVLDEETRPEIEDSQYLKPLMTWPRLRTLPAMQPSQPRGKTGPSSSGSAQPMKATKSGKYSTDHGLYSESSLGFGDNVRELPESLKSEIVKNANASLSYQTWRSVRSVKRLIETCEIESNVSMRFPWDNSQYTAFSAWCLRKNKRKNTIQCYISKV